MISVLVPDSVNYINVTENVINELISCPKHCTNKKKTKTVVRGMHRNTHYDVASVDGRHEFEMIVRQSTVFEEDFSVILRYRNKDNEWTSLFRCNCKHFGEPISQPLHNKFHTHMISEKDWKKNGRSQPNLRLEASYVNLTEAIAFFCEHCRIPDMVKYFPESAAVVPVDDKQVRLEELLMKNGDENGDQPCGAN